MADEGKLTMQFIMHGDKMDPEDGIEITVIIKNEDWHPIRVAPPDFPASLQFSFTHLDGSRMNYNHPDVHYTPEASFPILVPGDKIKYHYTLKNNYYLWTFESGTTYQIKVIYDIYFEDELWYNSCWEGRLESATKTFTVI